MDWQLVEDSTVQTDLILWTGSRVTILQYMDLIIWTGSWTRILQYTDLIIWTGN